MAGDVTVHAFLIVLFVVCYSATLALLTNRRIGRCIAPGLISMGLILYISQMVFASFQPGIAVLLFVTISVIPAMIIYRRRVKVVLFTNGLSCFLIAAVIFTILDYHRSFTQWDELSHWGMMTKEMLRLDNWYSVPASRLLVHKDYPPFVSIIEMLGCKLAGGYSEAKAYLMLHLFSVSMVTPFLADSIQWKKETRQSGISSKLQNGDHDKKTAVFEPGYSGMGTKAKIWVSRFFQLLLLNCLVMVIIAAVCDAAAFMSIYKDIVLALIFVYGALLIADRSAVRDRIAFWSEVNTCVALLLTKQMGMTFVLVLWIYYAITFLNEQKIAYQNKGVLIARFAGQMLILGAVPMLFQYTWKHYIEKLGLMGQFELSKIRVSDIAAMLRDSDAETLRRQTFNAFCHALFENNVTALVTPLPYFLAFLIVIALIWGLRKWNISCFTRDDALELGTTFVLGTLGYAFTMSILYLFCFSEQEMQRLASYNRYMSSWILSEFLILFCIFIAGGAEKHWISTMHLLMGFICLAMIISSPGLKIFVPSVLDGTPNGQYRNIADALELRIAGDDSVFILSNNTILTQYYVNYYADDITVVLCYDDI